MSTKIVGDDSQLISPQSTDSDTIYSTQRWPGSLKAQTAFTKNESDSLEQTLANLSSKWMTGFKFVPPIDEIGQGERLQGTKNQRNRLPPENNTETNPTAPILASRPTVEKVETQFIPSLTAFDPHPADERSDEWWTEEIQALYTLILDFADKHFCGAHIKPPRDGNAEVELSYWALINPSAHLQRYVDLVATADPKGGGWEELLADRTQRRFLIAGILAKVLEVKVWSSLLFGADEDETDFLKELEKKFVHLDGYQRTALRCKIVRTMLDTSPTTPLFLPNATDLTHQIFALLQPFDAIQSSPRVRYPHVLDVEGCLQNLFDIVGKAAYLSLAVRVSNTIMHIRSESPGEAYNSNEQFTVNYDVYLKSKQRVDLELDERRSQSDSEREQVNVERYEAVIKIAVWPSFTRYTPGSGKAGGDKDGFRIYEVSKYGALHYWARKDTPHEGDVVFGDFLDKLRKGGVLKWILMKLLFWK